MSIGDVLIWSTPELWSDRAKEKWIPDMFLFYLDHAEQSGNTEYLRRLAAGLPRGEDPYGRIAAEARAILARLDTD